MKRETYERGELVIVIKEADLFAVDVVSDIMLNRTLDEKYALIFERSKIDDDFYICLIDTSFCEIYEKSLRKINE